MNPKIPNPNKTQYTKYYENIAKQQSGPQNAHVTGTPSSSNSSPSPNSIAASSNSISSTSNNNNINNNNNNADTSPVYIKHPQSPSPTGQLQQPLRMPPPQQGINEVSIFFPFTNLNI